MIYIVLCRESIRFCRWMFMFQVVLPVPMLFLKDYFCFVNQLGKKSGL